MTSALKIVRDACSPTKSDEHREKTRIAKAKKDSIAKEQVLEAKRSR
jgi:hypothetical protein